MNSEYLLYREGTMKKGTSPTSKYSDVVVNEQNRESVENGLWISS
jgi:hypothetical protein